MDANVQRLIDAAKRIEKIIIEDGPDANPVACYESLLELRRTIADLEGAPPPQDSLAKLCAWVDSEDGKAFMEDSEDLQKQLREGESSCPKPNP